MLSSSIAWLHCVYDERPASFSLPDIPMGVWETSSSLTNPAPPSSLFLSCSISSRSPDHSPFPGFFPSLSLSFAFYLGRHPGQIVALRISLKGCWWSTLPSLSKCAQVHLREHCLEMDNWSWRRKGKEGTGEKGRQGKGDLHICLPDEAESLFGVAK